MTARRLLFLPLLAALTGAAAAPAAATVEVVTTLSAYAAIAREVGGDRVSASSISRGDEDAHFVKPKPSFALRLKRADIFVATGLDLELWAPTLIEKSGQRALREGQPGYVSASEGVPLSDVPVSADRSGGDVHLYGNPHITTNPLNAKRIAANIAAGLARVDPAGAEAYEAGRQRFSRRIDEATFGPELVALLGGDVLEDLARSGALMDFLEERTLEGRSLGSRLGGWLGRAQPLRGRRIITYHKNWTYLTDLLGIEVAGYVEPKPGIPPSARHVHQLVQLCAERGVEVLLAASYFSPQQVEMIAERARLRPVVVPLGPLDDGPSDYFALVDVWIDGLLGANGPVEGRR